MSEKKYAIVRVDNSCPFLTEYMENSDCRKVFDCEEFWEDEPCSKKCNYGDTKEQLIRKIAQVLFKEELGWYAEYPKIIPNGKIDEPFCRIIYENCLNKATKIVGFLGVEE